MASEPALLVARSRGRPRIGQHGLGGAPCVPDPQALLDVLRDGAHVQLLLLSLVQRCQTPLE